MPECLLVPDLTNPTVGETKSAPSCVSYRRINSNVCNSRSHFTLRSSSPCLHGEDGDFPTNRRTVGSSNETMYAQPLPESKELTYKCIFSPVGGSERSTGHMGFADLQCAENQCVTVCERPASWRARGMSSSASQRPPPVRAAQIINQD